MSRKQSWSLLLIGVLLLMTLTACKAKNKDVPTLEEPKEEIPTATERQSSLHNTVLYYADDAGYLVPVMRRLPFEEGIAKAALMLLVTGEQNDMDAKRMGLHTVIPENTAIDLHIEEGVAKVSLSKEATKCEDAATESNMIQAIVSTLTEFPTVEKVQIDIEGSTAKLPHGTTISKALTRSDINLESVAKGTSIKGAKRVMLYFESDSAGTMVPIARAVFGRADVETAVVELLKGPKKDSGLLGTMPADAALISVNRKEGVLTINFTQAFKKVLDKTDGGKQAIKSLVLTCSEFPDVNEVHLQVEGKPFDVDQATMAMPTYANVDGDSVDQATMNVNQAPYDANIEIIPD